MIVGDVKDTGSIFEELKEFYRQTRASKKIQDQEEHKRLLEECDHLGEMIDDLTEKKKNAG